MTGFDPHEFTEELRRKREEEEAKQRANGAGGAQQQQGNSPPPLIEFSAVEPKPIIWTWWPRIPAGHITLIAGKGGACKGFVGMHATACITTGRNWPDDEPNGEAGRHVLWCETEDPLEQVIIPRAMAAGVDRSHATFADRKSFVGIQDLRKFIIARQTSLIVLSPLMSFLAGLTNIRDEHNVRNVLEQLQASVEGLDCAILGLAHTNKKPDLTAVERILGAVGFANFVRSVMLAAKEKTEDDDQDQPEKVRLVHAKYNLSPKAPDLICSPVHIGAETRSQYVKLNWTTPAANVDADAIFDRPKPNGHANGNDKQTAREWLADYLQTNGRSLRADVFMAAAKSGYSEEAMRKAQGREKHVHHWQEDGNGPCWWWWA
jgi:hypothetical protein